MQAYGSWISKGVTQMILNWPGTFGRIEHLRRIPTCLLYDRSGNLVSWGLEAKETPPSEGLIRCEWFRLFLEPKASEDEGAERNFPVRPCPSSRFPFLVQQRMEGMYTGGC